MEKDVPTDTSVMTSKGQLVIPARLRRKFGIQKGTVIAFIEEKGRIVLQPVTPEFIRGLRGSLRGEKKDVPATREKAAEE